MVRDYTKEIVDGHPDVDDVIVDGPDNKYQGFSGFFKLTKMLREQHFDTALLLHPTLRLALLCWFSGIHTRVGTAFRIFSFLFNKRVKVHRKKSGQHECDLNLKLAEAIGAKSAKVEFKIFIPENAEQTMGDKAHFNGLDLTRPFMVIHPGSGGSALDWPLDKFGKLADKVQDELKMQVVLTGSPSEKPLIDTVISHSQLQIIRLDGQLSIKELAAVLKKSAIVVANSTGPLHLADAVGAKVVGLYCPLQPCRPERWGPYSQLDSVVMPSIDGCELCSRCSYKNCMELIPVDKVFNKIKSRII